MRGILQRCTECMVRHLKAAFACIWTLNEGENVLELQASAGMYRLRAPVSSGLTEWCDTKNESPRRSTPSPAAAD